uniref:Uncharacterized protein n=1 Tax=uncultured marine crenarchaeote HF4000_APKG10I20 TaxID=455612 RepID=B3TCB9_9ARCH|nr:hypothetical protein ALOHA_HF4000APKG10I20ctg7g15 [uncultured marine crenarchaeote HF4000_APKG10I20]
MFKFIKGRRNQRLQCTLMQIPLQGIKYKRLKSHTPSGEGMKINKGTPHATPDG